MKLCAALLLLACTLVALAPAGVGADNLAPPLNVPAGAWRPLAQRWDKGLQIALDRAVRQKDRWQSLIYEKKMAVGLVDLTNPQAPRFAQVNGDEMMYAASIPKLAILFAAFQAFDKGTLRHTPELHTDLVEMIRRSDNVASAQVVSRLGLNAIAQAVQDPPYRFYDRKRGGGIWVGGTYGGGDKNPDPLKNLTFAATANQVCNFYYLLAYGKLINPESSRQMLRILAFPDIRDKFVAALEHTVPAPRLYRKSGHLRPFFGDSVLVWADGNRRYILVALVDHADGEQILRDLVPLAEGLLRRAPAVRPAGRK